MLAVECWCCMSICILLLVTCSYLCYVTDLCCCILLSCLSHMFIEIICWWLFIWLLDAFRSISFSCCKMGRSCNESRIFLWVFMLWFICVQCFRGSYTRYSKIKSILSESLPSIKKGEILVACPYYLIILLLVLLLSSSFF